MDEGRANTAGMRSFPVKGSGVLCTDSSEVMFSSWGSDDAIELVHGADGDPIRSFVFEVPRGTFFVDDDALVQLRDHDAPFHRWRFSQI